MVNWSVRARGFIEQENVANARKFLMNELNTISVDTPTSHQDSQHCSTVETAGSSSKRSGWDSVLDSSSEDENDNSINDDLEAQVNAYFNEKCIGRFDDPLYYLKARAVQWPQLTQVVGKYFACEREFEVEKNVSSDERIRLLPENIERLQFLKFNLRAIGYKTEQLKPTDAITNDS